MQFNKALDSLVRVVDVISERFLHELRTPDSAPPSTPNASTGQSKANTTECGALADCYIAAEIDCTKTMQTLAQHMLPVCVCVCVCVCVRAMQMVHSERLTDNQRCLDC
jgi:hypothetical protein